jgi:hypothetical protein
VVDACRLLLHSPGFKSRGGVSIFGSLWKEIVEKLLKTKNIDIQTRGLEFLWAMRGLSALAERIQLFTEEPMFRNIETRN